MLQSLHRCFRSTMLVSTNRQLVQYCTAVWPFPFPAGNRKGCGHNMHFHFNPLKSRENDLHIHLYVIHTYTYLICGQRATVHGIDQCYQAASPDQWWLWSVVPFGVTISWQNSLKQNVMQSSPNIIWTSYEQDQWCHMEQCELMTSLNTEHWSKIDTINDLQNALNNTQVIFLPWVRDIAYRWSVHSEIFLAYMSLWCFMQDVIHWVYSKAKSSLYILMWQ